LGPTGRDPEVGRKCRAMLGEEEADRLFGELIRCHRPELAARYLEVHHASAEAAVPAPKAQDSSAEQGSATDKAEELPTGREETKEEEEQRGEEKVEEVAVEDLAVEEVKKELPSRADAIAQRWSKEKDDSEDEAIGVISGIGRTISLWSGVAWMGLSSAISMSSDPTAAGLQIANMCRTQGGLYVKLAQWISAMPFAFPDKVLEEFQNLQDKADPQPWSVVGERVKKHTLLPIEDVYEVFDEDASNAASVAQVHRARRRTGETVAVKIIRKDIQSTYGHDIEEYMNMIGMYEYATGIQVRWAMEYGVKELPKELDLRYEADLHEEMGRFVSKHSELRGKMTVPELHSELCTKRLLVMEWIDGCKIIDAPKHFPDWNKERDVKAIFEVVENWMAMQTFISGKFHGDPHPGNIMIRRIPGTQAPLEGRPPSRTCPFQVVAIDHGGYFTLDESDRKLYAEAWMMMSEPKDEAQRLARRERLRKILNDWGIEHISRFVIEQMMAGNMGAKDPTGTLRENGDARMHRWNRMHNIEPKGPLMFADAQKMSPTLMKVCGCGNFTRAAWAQLSKGIKGWDFQNVRIEIMVKWAKKSPGAAKPP